MTADLAQMLADIDSILETDFDTQLAVERDPYGATRAIEAALYMLRDQSARIEALTAERDQWIQHAKNAVWADSEEVKLLTADNALLRKALIDERTETLWNAYGAGMERDGRWRHMCMSDGEWLEHECGLDDSQPDHPADVVKAAIPLAAERFVATLHAGGAEK